jgi:cell division protein FtsN
MKTAAYIAACISGICLNAHAQQTTQEADRQPPAVTEKQVEQHAQMAVAERKKDEKQRHEPVKQNTESQNKDKGKTTGSADTQTAKKSSTKPEEQ